MFEDHYIERPPKWLERIYRRTLPRKKDFENLLLEYDVTGIEGVLPFSFLPRVMPCVYLDEIRQSTRTVTKFILNFLYDNEKNPSLEKSKFGEFVIKQLGVLDSLPERLIGGARYDLAVEGNPEKGNPPKLIEVNCIDYGGIAEVTYGEKALIETVPELKEHIFENNGVLDDLIQRIRMCGNSFMLIADKNSESAGEHRIIIKKAEEQGLKGYLIEDDEFVQKLKNSEISFRDGNIQFLDKTGRWNEVESLYLRSFSEPESMMNNLFAVEAYVEAGCKIVDGYYNCLLENKGLMCVLNDKSAQKKYLAPEEQLLLQKIVPKTGLLSDNGFREEVRCDANYAEQFVLKKLDEHHGNGVYVGRDMVPILDKITNPEEWCIQEMCKFNRVPYDSIKGTRRLGIADFAVYVSYVWNGKEKKLVEHNVLGFLVRASSENQKVNMSLGGAAVPTFIERGQMG